MKTWVRKSMRAGVLAAGLLLFAASPAQAGDQIASDNGGVLAGNNIDIPITAAVPICGNAVAVLGVAVSVAQCTAGAANIEDEGDDHGDEENVSPRATGREEADQIAYDNGGVLSGNNIHVPVTVAAPICGNAIAVLGLAIAAADCDALAVNYEGDDDKDGDSDGDYAEPHASEPVEDTPAPTVDPTTDAPVSGEPSLPGTADLNVPDATLPLVDGAPTDALSNLVGGGEESRTETSVNGTDLGTIVEDRMAALEDAPILN